MATTQPKRNLQASLSPSQDEEDDQNLTTTSSTPSLSSAISTGGGDESTGEEDVSTSDAGDETDGEEPITGAAPTTTGPSTLAIRERGPLTQRIVENLKLVQQAKVGRTPEERAAALKNRFDEIEKGMNTYQQTELNRKGKDGLSLQDRLDQTKRHLDDLEQERKGTIQSNQWGQIAEQMGNALNQTMAGLYGLKHNVNLSGLPFNRSNWEERLKILLGDVNDRMDHEMKADQANQGIAAKIGETAYRTGEKERAEVIRADQQEQAGADKANEQMGRAAIEGTTHEYDAQQKADEGARNRTAAMERTTAAQTAMNNRSEKIQNMQTGRAKDTELMKLNAERAGLGLAPLQMSDLGVSGASGGQIPSTPAVQQTQQTPGQTSGQTGQTQAQAGKTDDPTAIATKAVQGMAAVTKASGMGIDAQTATGEDVSSKALMNDLTNAPTNPIERKHFLEKRGAAKEEYLAQGGDSVANKSIRDLELIKQTLLSEKGRDLSGTFADKNAAVAGNLPAWMGGKAAVALSERGRPDLIKVKGRLQQIGFKGMKTVFGGRISNTEVQLYTAAVWDSRLPPQDNAERVDTMINQIKANRDIFSSNTAANQKFDQETDSMIKQGNNAENSNNGKKIQDIMNKLPPINPESSKLNINQ